VNQRLGNQNATTKNGNHPASNLSNPEVDCHRANEALVSAPNAILHVYSSSSSSTLQKPKVSQVFKENVHNNKQQEVQEPSLGGSSSSDGDDGDVIEHSFHSSSSSSSNPGTANNTLLHQFSTSPTSLSPQPTIDHPILPSKRKLALSVSPSNHSEIPLNSQQIANYTHYSQVPGCRCNICLHHRKCTLAQTPLNCPSCQNCTTCRPFILAIDRPPHEYFGCFVSVYDTHIGMKGKKDLGMIVDYDASTKQYEILMEEEIEAMFTYNKVFFGIKEMEQCLRWNARRCQVINLFREGNNIISYHIISYHMDICL